MIGLLSVVSSQGGYTFHKGVQQVAFPINFNTPLLAILSATVGDNRAAFPAYAVMYNNDEKGGLKKDSMNVLTYNDVSKVDYTSGSVAFFWAAIGI